MRCKRAEKKTAALRSGCVTGKDDSHQSDTLQPLRRTGRLTEGCSEALPKRFESFSFFDQEIAKDNSSAFLNETAGDTCSNSSGTPGYDGNLVFQSESG